MHRTATSSTVDRLRRYEVADNSLLLRRYLPGPFFEDMVTRRELYFTSAAKFKDQLEGRRTAWDERKTLLKLERWRLRFYARSHAMAQRARDESEDNNRHATVICCFVAGEEHAASKWSEKGPESVAIETTVGRLRTN